MRVVSLLLVSLLLSVVSAGEGGAEAQSREKFKPPKTPEEYRAMLERVIANVKKERENAPTTLAEAHERLEQMLSAEELAKVDAMPSQRGMSKYHMGLGAGIRNGWGLWGDLPLAKHMRELGFTHADDMSGVILDTFWCKRHGKDFRLEERAAKYKGYWDATKKDQEEEERRVEESKAAIRKMMMGLRLEQRDVPVVRMRIGGGLNVRFSCAFGDGVFLTGYCQGSMSEGPAITGGRDIDRADNTFRTEPQYDDVVRRGSCFDRATHELRPMKPGEDFYIQGWYFDPADANIHWINVPEVNNVYAAVVADERAWFAGLTNENPVLVGVGDQDRLTVPLPQADEIPDLGLDGQSLLAVYSKTIYRLTEGKWALVHSGDIVLPRSGLPPQRHGNKVFLRDEGQGERRRRLWWLTMGETLHLHLLDHDAGLFAPIVRHDSGVQSLRFIGPGGWEETSSYCVTSNGDLWACLAHGSYLLRRSQDGTYACAIAEKSIQFGQDPSGSGEGGQGLSISGITALPDDSLLLVGRAGLYRLKGNELAQVLAFAADETPDSRGRVVHRLRWSPTNVAALDDGSYFVSTSSWDSVYWLRPGDDGQWTCQPAGRGDPVVW